MKKDAIKIGFTQEADGEKKIVRDVFEYFEPASFDEMLVDASKETILEYYNAHRRVVCQNTGGRDCYSAYMQGVNGMTLDDVKKYVREWKPGTTFTNNEAKKNKAQQLMLNDPEALKKLFEMAKAAGISLE
jgi:hypothetical protein